MSHGVRLLEGPFLQRQDVHLRYLLEIEPDRLLAPFRIQAGLEPKGERYGGWESRDISGHSLGHYLSALSYMQEARGEERIRARIAYIVEELSACQQANGGGYVLPVDRTAFERLKSGEIEASPFALNGVWVPFYTLHKLLAGLRDAWRISRNPLALEVSIQLCDWIDGVLEGLDMDQVQKMLQCEHGGMNEVLADLSADTGDSRYLRMASEYFHHQTVLEPMLRGEDCLDGLHGNTQIPKVVGLAREYELAGDARFRLAATSFWDAVVNHRSYAVGGHGESEHFFPVEQFPRRLTPNTCETCNTYNMLKLTKHLFAWDPQASHMDFVERAMINHLAANIGRAPGEFGYFLGLGSVAVKVFSTPFDSWWCCVGTGLENPSRYGEQIYHSDEDALWINLYIGSVLTDDDRGVTLRQDTVFPEEETVRFIFVRADGWSRRLKFRHPSWCVCPEVKINGQQVRVASSPGSYFTIERTWNEGDTVELRLPMTLRLEALPHSGDSVVVVMHGPVVLAAVVPEEPGIENPARKRFSEHLDARGKTDAVPPVFVVNRIGDILDSFELTERFDEFRSTGVLRPGDLNFIPLHRIYEEQYAVYLSVYTATEWQEKEGEIAAERSRQLEVEKRTIDNLSPGYQQPEVEHRMACERSHVGDFQGRKFRESLENGWFSYELKVSGNGPVELVATYWGGEWSYRNFDILVGERRIATQLLRTNKPGDFFEMVYPIPEELTREQAHITVRFTPHPGSTVGRLFGLRVMSPRQSDSRSRNG